MKVPEHLGRYKVREMIAKGGMGKIYRASDELIGRDVAIKIVDTSEKAWPESTSDIIRRQFEQEMRISGQLSHHTFVTIYDAGTQDSLHYLVMELLGGATLNKIIAGHGPKLDMKHKLEILIQVGNALYYSHQRGIIHRDIKPSNIMLMSNGQTKVMDFGVAYAAEESELNLKEEDTGVIGGTPYYMSPEQINHESLDGRSDLFSLAVVAYELLTGKRPFTAENRFALYERILRVDPKPVKEMNPAIPDKIAATITLCLNKEPGLRLRSCKAFADQLDEIVHENFFASDGEAITNETLKILRQYRESFSFFFDLDNSQIYRLLQVCQTRDYKKGDVIFEEGSIAREMYLLLSGAVRISRGRHEAGSILILTLRRGEVFGEMGIIDGGPRSASAKAETDCRVLALHQVSLLRCDDSTAGKLYRNLSNILSTKLRVTSARLDQFSSQPNL